ncbi:hypothetical protein [Neobacillus ginsengisoli]|uniref:Group-specific protein n=1 Tax=Neobacillus ginsengisoli TaxID=904295 RepID=A0ABT9XPX8_9BACI|nr:hypothetical protein [Neobacillus ginsengisoli]MDQ0197598.1 hypothetical protein [Neobacillus ginsengisoli]
MFDPTAFDNMKVVIEGALYDMDISGEIIIIDRNDIMNMAKLSRRFDICFTLPNSERIPVSAKIEMEAHLINLAAELLTVPQTENEGGCQVRLQFFIEHAENKENYPTIQKIFMDIWGETRKINQSVQYHPLSNEKKIKNSITVEFDRLISEEQLDDLVEMTDFMITTLKQLQSCKSIIN